MAIRRVASAEEAVRLAAELQQSGDCDWLRGQVQNWTLRSSYARRGPIEQEGLLQQVGRFEHWVKRTPGLESLAGHSDAVIAVAQHYGIPTNFIDFTTDPAVAGFFASERPPSDPLRESCIMCLNTQDLQRFWRSMSSRYPTPESLRLDVSNLWRLEAQSGVFLFCPYANLEEIYDLDRIVFPYTGRVQRPKVHEIYPDRKSHLEILLDQYFMIERLREGDLRVEEQVARGLWSVHRADTRERWSPDLVVAGGPSPLRSWDNAELQPWLSPEKERYSLAQSDLVVDIPLTPHAVISTSSLESLRRDIKKRVSALESMRQHLVVWKINLDDNAVLSEQMSDAVARLWDGLRVLPYDMEDLAEAVANCILLALVARSTNPANIRDLWLHAASVCFGDSIEVEFGSDDSSYARAYVGRASLLGAVRDDIGNFLTPEYSAELRADMVGLLQAVQDPNRLFEFDRLANVFARQIVPTQVLIRGGSAIFYSPARLDAFGLP
jgi:hypothetical protein